MLAFSSLLDREQEAVKNNRRKQSERTTEQETVEQQNKTVKTAAGTGYLTKRETVTTTGQ
jgi:hypothetical protein